MSDHPTEDDLSSLEHILNTDVVDYYDLKEITYEYIEEIRYLREGLKQVQGNRESKWCSWAAEQYLEGVAK